MKGEAFRCFLYERSTLEGFLVEAHGLSLVWLIVGEKTLYGEWLGGRNQGDLRRVSVFRQVYELESGLAKPMSRRLGLLGSDGSPY